MIDYAWHLAQFEREIGTTVDARFVETFNGIQSLGKHPSLEGLLLKWHKMFTSQATALSTIPLAIGSKQETHLVTQSLLYSSHLVLHGGGNLVDEYWSGPGYRDIPQLYLEYLAKYHDLIRKNVCVIVPDGWEKIDSAETTVDRFAFSPQDFGCASVKSNMRWLANDPDCTGHSDVHVRLLLPNVQGISDRDMLSLVNDDEIFVRYHAALNRLNLGNRSLGSGEKLEEVMLEVDSRFRDLNARFDQLRRTRAWQATKALFGFSVAAFAFILPGDLARYVQAILGSATLVSALEASLGYIRTESELKGDPYYFALKLAGRVRTESTARTSVSVAPDPPGDGGNGGVTVRASGRSVQAWPYRAPADPAALCQP